MLIWEIVLALGAIGSLGMWLRELVKYRRPLKERIYPVVAIALAVAAVLLYSENRELRDPTDQAQILVRSWPASAYDGECHEAQAKGIVLAGLRYLETYKHLSPDTYERHLKAYDETDFSDSLQATDAADTMITTIKSYAGEVVKLN